MIEFKFCIREENDISSPKMAEPISLIADEIIELKYIKN